MDVVNDNVRVVLNKLNNQGYEAYIVGGALRDMYLGNDFHDIDITTKASLKEISEVFADYKQKKYKKGHTIGVIIHHQFFEISTFDGNDIYEDLANRDFSINALAYNEQKGLIDPYNGLQDIKDKLIRTIKEPDIIIQNDPARIIRAIRFAATKQMRIDESLIASMLKNKDLLITLNKERIQNDFSRILLVEKPSSYIRDYFPIFAAIIPPLKRCYHFNQKTSWHHLDVFEHIMTVLDATKPDLVLRLAALFHDIEKPSCFSLDDQGLGHFYQHFIPSAKTAEVYLSQFKYSLVQIERVTRLIYFHDRPIENNDKSIQKFLNAFGTNDLDLFFSLKRADIIGQNPALIDRVKLIDEIEKRAYEIIEENQVFTIRNLAINGHDLMKLGFEGIKIRIALDKILPLVIEKKLDNDRDLLIQFARRLKD